MTINCKGQLIDLSSPKVMGILNVTPDSFYDGGEYQSETAILNQVEKMLTDGATFLDIGAYSSRPGADDISESEEIKRLVPVIEAVLKRFPECLVSVDTFRSAVADKALNVGAALINDISGGHLDSDMYDVIAKHRVPHIIMHMRGTPQTMLQHTDYDDLLIEMNLYFAKIIEKTITHKIHDVIIDPGFGFSKTLEQNYQLLNQMDLLQAHERPILVGMSRKSMIYKALSITPQEALNGTTVLNTIALQKGASILRVHDVKEAMECIRLWELTNN